MRYFREKIYGFDAMLFALSWLLLSATIALPARVEFARDFAPSEGWVKAPEQPYRQDICLNGSWRFQPVSIPANWKRGQGIAPELPMPAADKWEATPIKIPSPWNVNTWGAGRQVGEGTAHPYWPSSVYFPSYPPHWDGVEMAWLQRNFRVPESWSGRRIVLHFEAIGGQAQVFVNGKKAGEHFDRYLPFELDITDLARRDAENELLVGVRSMRLFDLKSEKYKHMRTPYPPGSNTDNLSGIWQDVFLLGLPAVRVADVFVKPWVGSNILEAEVVVRNDSAKEQSIELTGTVQPWINSAGTNILDAPEPRWSLGSPAMALPPKQMTLRAGESKTVVLSEKVNDRLKLWSPDSPNLNGLVLTVNGGNTVIDRSYTRFGWRECRIAGTDFLLNGKKTQMYGDLLHPFGPFVNSRRYVWAWYKMIKEMHGNAVRPHAQPHPRHYLDLADEMGLLVLDETAMFGSSLQLNFEAPVAWERYAEHYDNLIQRDRNHPSVFGWSWGNELFAIFIYDKGITKEQTDAWYRQLAELGGRGARLDPTRNWFSCDGDEDLRGTQPVWNKHFGHGLPNPDWLPRTPTKPLMVGESGGSYYARPGQLAVFNGERALAGYRGRNEALAIDVYDNVASLARPRLAFFSPAETAWFGLEHLPLGYHDFTRLPNANDGVWCKPFEENKPGVQPERLPPYVCTFNPGWDPALPLYKPLAMFEAQKAAQAPAGPQPCPWDHKSVTPAPGAAAVQPTIQRVAFAGRQEKLWNALASFGVPLVPMAQADQARLLLLDGETFAPADLEPAKKLCDAILANQGTVLVMLRRPGEISPALQQILPAKLVLTAREATALKPVRNASWTAGFSLPDLYFAEDARDKKILKCGLEGPLVQQGQVLFEASDNDWSLFIDMPENAKCGAVVLYEQLQKPAGAALVSLRHGGGTLVVSAIDCVPDSSNYAKFWRKLLGALGVRLDANTVGGKAAPEKEHDLLLNGPTPKS